MKRFVFSAVIVLAFAAYAIQTTGRTSISTGGIIESRSGGFKFPDGSVQETSATTAIAPVSDTGQRGCFDTDGVSRYCIGSGEDGEYQVGVAWPTPRFTKNPNETITDHLTGLVWYDTEAVWAEGSWESAFEVISLLNDVSEFNDWRLPNINELLSLVDWSQPPPYFTQGNPFTYQRDYYFWSSTVYAFDVQKARAVNFTAESVSATSFKTSTFAIWPVRGPSVGE